jgi:hypothetical protein
VRVLHALQTTWGQQQAYAAATAAAAVACVCCCSRVLLQKFAAILAGSALLLGCWLAGIIPLLLLADGRMQ